MRESRLAFDRDSVRTTDNDGRLHVALTHISKANVCEYWGREIPDYEELGLAPDRKYKLYRDPDELQKGAETFNKLPLLSEHVPVTADDHRPELVIGATGTDSIFNAPYLDNSLVIWARNGIAAVESEEKKELSSAYRYRADMTAGRSPEGEEYDGIMRDIVGNHVAIVKEGRAGSDVVVGDSNEELIMANKAIILTRKGSMLMGVTAGALLTRMAKDAKPIDLAKIFDGVHAKNFKDKRDGIVAGLRTATKGQLAQDANIDDVIALVDKFEQLEPAEGVDAAGNAVTDPSAAVGPAMKPKGADAASNFLKEKLGADDYQSYQDMMAGEGGAEDAEETEEEKKIREAKEAADQVAKDEEDKKKEAEGKKAMDQKIKVAVDSAVAGERKRQKDLRVALDAVRPWIGQIAMDHDTADDVYRTTLTTLNVDVKDVHPSAFPAILAQQPKPGSRPATPRLGQDTAEAKGYTDRFPGADKIGV